MHAYKKLCDALASPYLRQTLFMEHWTKTHLVFGSYDYKVAIQFVCNDFVICMYNTVSNDWPKPGKRESLRIRNMYSIAI